jgi:hypothetical protein
MSGYLHRAVAAIRHAGGSIHPLLGSVLSASPVPGNVEDPRIAYGASGLSLAAGDTSHQSAAFGSRGPQFEVAAEVRAAATLSADQASDAPGDMGLGATAERRLFSLAGLEAGASRAGEHNAADAARVADGVRVRSGGSRAFGSGAPDDSHTGADGGHDIPAAPDAHGSLPPALLERDPRIFGQDGRVEPLMPLDPLRAVVANVMVSHPLPVSAAAGRNATSEALRSTHGRSGQSQREADDIQIHIGRIEVTAVAPTAARPPPAPRPTSPSLDEYLKRRTGRSG